LTYAISSRAESATYALPRDKRSEPQKAAAAEGSLQKAVAKRQIAVAQQQIAGP